MTPGVGLVPKLIFRARKIPIVFLQPPWFFQKMTPGVGLVFGEVPKLIFRARKITFRRTFLLYSCNCHGFFRKMTPGVGLVVGEVPKLIFRVLATAMVFRKMTPGVGLVVGGVPKLIFRGRKIIFRRTLLLYSCNCHGFSKNDSWSGFGGWRGPKTYFQG